MPEVEPTSDVAALTVQLLSAYLANNTVPSEDIAGLIRSTRDALTQGADTLGQGEPETFTPAVSVRKSLASPDHIISLIDGKPYKTLKRHLMGHGLTPEAYRSRYNLPLNYPMVAPAYGEHRRNIAKEAGLGTRRAVVQDPPMSNVEESVDASIEDAGATEPQSGPEGMTASKPSATAKESKALATDEATIDEAALTSNVSEASAVEHDTSSDAPARPGSQDDPEPVTSKAKATSSAKSQGAKAPKAKSSKRQIGTPKQNIANEPAPSDQTSPEGSSDAADKQDPQASATKPRRRAKIGLFGEVGAKPDEPANGSASQSSESSLALQGPESDEGTGSAKTAAKRKSPERIARTLKTSSDTQADETGNSDEPAS